MLSLLIGLALAGEPNWRWITSDQGLRSEHVDDLALDPQGVVWIATHAGLYRWDGAEATRVDGGAITHELLKVVVDQRGVAVAADALGRGWWLEQGQAAMLRGADGAEVEVWDLALASDGSAVALSAEGLRPVAEGAVGAPLGVALPPGARLLRRGPADAWLIGTHEGLWRVATGLTPTRLADANIAVDAEVAPDGSVWLLDNYGTVQRVDALGAVLARTHLDSRGLSLALRGAEAWVSLAGALLVVQPDGATQVWGPERGVFTGGPLLVDAEGSVWLGTYRGLGQLAEPGAALWDRRDGLPGESNRYVEEAGGRVWVSGWAGLGWVDPETGRGATFEGPVIKNPLCADAEGALWTLGTDGFDGPGLFVRLSDPPSTWPVRAASHFTDGCAVAPDGSVWLSARDGLYRASGPAAPTLVSPWPVPALATAGKQLTVEADGTVWVGGGPDVCGADPPGPWRCVRTPGRASVSDLLVTDSGALWVADIDLGVSRLDGDALVPLGGVAALPSRHILGLARSRRGGVWVLGHGVVSRVVERPDLPEGWSVEEELAPWLGHLVSGATDLLERADGALWIAHNGGLTSVSASARVRPSAPPPVLVSELRVDGRPVPEREVELPSPRSHLSLKFNAASWRAPALLRYRVRTDAGAWGAAVQAGWLELRDLAPGAHTVEIAASLDGARWSEPPALVRFTVPRPWYGRPEPWIALVCLGLVGLVLVQRARFHVAMRLASLRTRIALDLHDHMGAGLGAIGLMAELLGARVLPEDAAASTAGRIAATSADLGASLRGIVWSLRPDSQWTDELGRWLAQRARDLFPDLDRAQALSVSTSTHRVGVDLDVLRAVQLIGLEALHNAARHARATRVALALEPAASGWRLTVDDDGVGLGAGAAERADEGNGLSSMRARAASVGAALQIGPSPLGGVRVGLQFQPRARAPWWRRAP